MLKVGGKKAGLADFFEEFPGFRTQFKVQFGGREGGTGFSVRKSWRNGDYRGRIGRFFRLGVDRLNLLAEGLRVTVGTLVAQGPPYRSVRADFPHTALILDV